ncbi:MAG: cell division protein FtsZ [Bacteroidales bacterium]|nr:cell division protein FtsZ [Bacteroidales bacterium]
MEESINFTPDFGAKENTSTIKVIGVGGGGSNAVQHMYAEGIQGVDYLVCNTDKCHLDACKIQDKLLLGNGLGAGANPDVAREFASKSEDKIKEFIGENTKMLFIAAGMGKGTGTGASPVVAKVAKEMGILTVGVVTEPFKFEGKRIKAAAENGIEEMSKYVDSLIIVNNQNLMKYYNSLPINEAYGQVDDILKNAVKCVAEIVTVTHGQNVDFNDVKSIMEHSGKALLGIAIAQGEDRVQKVLDDVLNCPLLENADISDAKNFLFFVTYGPNKQITMGELEILQDRFDDMQADNVHVIWGHGIDETLGDNIKLSLVVTNFDSAREEKNEIIIDNSGETIANCEEENPQVEDTEKRVEEFAKEQDQVVAEPQPVVAENDTVVSDPLFPETRNMEMSFSPAEPQISFPSNDNSDLFKGVDYNNDDDFFRMVNQPTINRSGDVFSASQNKPQVAVEEANNAVYYELKDDTFDVFHGFAD